MVYFANLVLVAGFVK